MTGHNLPCLLQNMAIIVVASPLWKDDRISNVCMCESNS